MAFAEAMVNNPPLCVKVAVPLRPITALFAESAVPVITRLPPDIVYDADPA
jgi:hypothetical protein